MGGGAPFKGRKTGPKTWTHSPTWSPFLVLRSRCDGTSQCNGLHVKRSLNKRSHSSNFTVFDNWLKAGKSGPLSATGVYLRRVDVVLSYQDARRVQRPVDFISQAAFKGSDGIKQPPQIPHLHEAVLSCCHQQVTESQTGGI